MEVTLSTSNNRQYNPIDSGMEVDRTRSSWTRPKAVMSFRSDGEPCHFLFRVGATWKPSSSSLMTVVCISMVFMLSSRSDMFDELD